MNSYFRRIPLAIKLILIGFIPLIFLIYLSIQLYNEKTQKVELLGYFIDRIHQSGNITALIDNLQLERRLSHQYALKNEQKNEMLLQRIQTDSSLTRLSRNEGINLTRFKAYTFLNELQSIRISIDSATITKTGIMDFYTNSIYRLNLLNTIPGGSNIYLQAVYKDIVAQKLLSEMTTYMGFMRANIDNALYTKEYMLEILLGTSGVYKVFNTYETEFLIKASPAAIKKYQQIRNDTLSLKPTIEYLNKLFTTYSFDNTYNAEQWWAVSGKGIENLRSLQQSIWKDVNKGMYAMYKEEQKERDIMLLLLILALVLVVTIIALTIFSISRMLHELKVGALKIARGATDIPFNIFSKDAIGSLAKSISKIDANNKQLSGAASEIGKGNFDAWLQPRGSEDVLGNALVQMKENLQLFTRQMEESKEQFRKLADFMPQMVWTAEPSGDIDYYNKQWYEFSGFKEGNFGDSWLSILHPDDVIKCTESWHRSVQSGATYEMEYRFKDKSDGTYKWFLGRALPVRNNENEIVKWFGTSTNIHERKTISEKLEILIRERTQELERSNSDLQQFAHVASHDLKEPLRKIRVFANLMHEEFENELPAQAKHYLNKMQSAAVRMSTMVDGVLNYSIATSSHQKSETIDLNEIIKEIEQDLEIMIQQQGASIIHANLPVIKGIPVLIYQLFYNLIINALKFSKQNQRNQITILYRESINSDLHENFERQKGKKYITIEVNDKGIGFDDVYAEKMFDIFSRLHAKDKYEGTGLGLALCRKIVLRHNGTIVAKGKLNEGASFNVILPV